jgi:hypothetical protein
MLLSLGAFQVTICLFKQNVLERILDDGSNFKKKFWRLPQAFQFVY